MDRIINDETFGSEKFFFYFPKNIFKFVGFWPGSDNIRWWQIAFAIFNALEVLIYGIFQVNFIIENKDNLVMMLNGLTPLVTQVVTSIKILFIVSRRRDIKKILDYLFNSFVNGEIGERRISNLIIIFVHRHAEGLREDQQALLQTRFSHFLHTGDVRDFNWFVLYCTADDHRNHSFCERHGANVRAAIQICVRSSQLSSSFIREFRSRFPFDIKPSPVYEIVYFCSAWSSWITTVGVAGAGSFFVALSMHICGQFEIVSSQMQSIAINDGKSSSGSDKILNKAENDRMYERLKRFVNFHNETIDMCELMTKTFAPMVFFHFLSASIVICVCCLMLFLAQGPEKVIYQAYLIGGMTDALTYTFGGTLLMETSSNVQVSIYNFEWYRCDVRCQKLILLAMIRANRPLVVKIPFFKASLDTFITVRFQNIFMKIINDLSIILINLSDTSNGWILRNFVEHIFGKVRKCSRIKNRSHMDWIITNNHVF